MRRRILYTVIPSLESGPTPVALVKESRSSKDYIRGQRNHGYVFFQYTLSGKGLFTSKRKSVSLPPGTLCLCDVNNNDYSYRFHPESNQPWEFIYIKIKGESFRIWTEDMNKKFGYIYHLPLDHSLIQNYLNCLNSHQKHYVISASDAVRMCANIQSALLERQEDQKTNKVKSQIVNDGITLIQERITLPLSVQEIADCLEISREHLSRIFKDQLGITPYSFIINTKMEKAKIELTQTLIPIKEIAYDMGFSSPELFTQIFKRNYKITPKQFRKMYSL